MDLYDRKMVINTNLKYADSSLNNYVIIMVQKFLKILNSKISKKIAFPRHKMPTLSKQQPRSGFCLRETRPETT